MNSFFFGNKKNCLRLIPLKIKLLRKTITISIENQITQFFSIAIFNSFLKLFEVNQTFLAQVFNSQLALNIFFNLILDDFFFSGAQLLFNNLGNGFSSLLIFFFFRQILSFTYKVILGFKRFILGISWNMSFIFFENRFLLMDFHTIIRILFR